MGDLIEKIEDKIIERNDDPCGDTTCMINEIISICMDEAIAVVKNVPVNPYDLARPAIEGRLDKVVNGIEKLKGITK